METMTKNSAKAAAGLSRRGLFLTLLSASVFFVAAQTVVPVSPARANPATVVKMTDAPPTFVPARVTIKVGGEVVWDNNGKVIHSVTANTPLPAGAQNFDSGFMMPGTKFAHTFTVPGTYHVVCIPHGNSGMVGEVVVKKSETVVKK